MGTLHVVSHAPGGSEALADCLRVVRPDDAVLFIRDGVYGAFDARLDVLPDAISVCALEPDVLARGLDARIGNQVRRLDQVGFVALCAEHDRVVSWS